MLEQYQNIETISDWKEYFKEWKQNVLNNPLVSDKTLKVNGKIINSKIEFKGEFKEAIAFHMCQFNHEIEIKDGSYYKEIMFETCEFIKGIDIGGDELKIMNKIVLWDCFGKITFGNGYYNNVYYRQTNNIQQCDSNIIYVTGGHYDNFEINTSFEAFIQKINLKLSQVSGNIEICGNKTPPDTNFLFEDNTSIIKSIEISGNPKDLNLSLIDIKVDKLKIKYFKSNSGIRFISIRPIMKNESCFDMIQAFLGKSEFTSINFMDFENIEIRDSYLLDSTFTNINWNYQINNKLIQRLQQNGLITHLEIYGYKNGLSYIYSKNRDVFKQIKQVYSKSGDAVTEQVIHSYEMLAYYKTLSWVKNFWTKSIIYLSRTTSNFGLSLKRPLILLFSGHFVLFIVLIFCLNSPIEGVYFTLNPTLVGTMAGFKNGFNWYFTLINPFRPFMKFDGFTVIIDLLMRIWSSYMIYNIIRASRRFIK